MFVSKFQEKHITQFDLINRQKIRNFLEEQELDFDESVQFTLAFFDDEKIIATGSFDTNVIKCLAVATNYQGYGLTNKVISILMNEQHRRGFKEIFVYTKPENEEIFTSFGFYKIIEIPKKVILLENSPDGFTNYINKLEQKQISGKRIAALIMNCNPFTLGHLYLIHTAAQENDVVHVFLVSENKSQFSTAIRYQLVLEGTKDLDHVYVHKGSKYIISAATFPSYFLKKKTDVTTTHAMLDLTIFSKYIAPALGINYRYVGVEQTCLVTAEYNRVMKELLPKHDIAVVEIPRLTVDGVEISASKVRHLLQKQAYDQIKKWVPPTTYNYLVKNNSTEEKGEKK